MLQIGGHSTRIAAALAANDNAASLNQIMLDGGWATPQMVVYYLHQSKAKTGAMANWAARSAPGQCATVDG